jgi:hypothetical protein
MCASASMATADGLASADIATNGTSAIAASSRTEVAEARFVLARALIAAHRDRGRALALARQARDALASAGPAGADLLAETDAWLTKHGASPR